MGIVFGLLSAVGFGFGDFTARLSSERIGAVRTLFYMQFVGAIVIGAYALLSGQLAAMFQAAGMMPFLLAVGNSGLNIIAAICLYRALAMGPVSVVAPITASYSALTIVLALLRGETLTPTHALGVALSIIGVAVVSLAPPAQAAKLDGVPDDGRDADAPQQRPRTTIPRSVPYAVVAAFGFAITFYVLGFYIVPEIGSIVPVFLSRMTTIVALAAAGMIGLLRLHRPTGDAVGWVFAVGVLDTVGFLALNLGLENAQVAIVSALSSQYSAITVLMAARFLRERLRPYQYGGLVLLFAGILLVSIPA